MTVFAKNRARYPNEDLDAPSKRVQNVIPILFGYFALSRTVLTLGIEPAFIAKIDTEIVCLADSEAILDWLWEKGDDVTEIIVRADLATSDLVDTIEHDWPSITFRSL